MVCGSVPDCGDRGWCFRFSVLSGIAATIAEVLFVVFLIFLVISVVTCAAVAGLDGMKAEIKERKEIAERNTAGGLTLDERIQARPSSSSSADRAALKDERARAAVLLCQLAQRKGRYHHGHPLDGQRLLGDR